MQTYRDTAGPAVDWQAFDEIREAGGDELVADIIETFLDDASKRVVALEAALDACATATAAREAHALKGAALTVGAKRLAELCLSIEMEAKDGALTHAQEQRGWLAPAWHDTRQLLQGGRRAS